MLRNNITLRDIFRHTILEYAQAKQVSIEGELEDYIFPYLKHGDRDDEINYIIKTLEGDMKTLFISLLNICDELRKYNIDSPEVLNFDNWGIKPTGKLALFDIGFGDWFEAFDEEPQELKIDEATDERVVKFTEIARKISKKLNLSGLKYLGGGMNGFAFEVNDNIVLKITKDRSEAVNSNKILGKKTDYLGDIYKILGLKDDETQYYIILLEKLDRTTITHWEEVLIELQNWFDGHRNMHYDPNVISYIEKKNPMVAGFLNDLVHVGYEPTWDKWRDKLKTDNTYDWNDIAEIAEWIKGSKTNQHDISDHPPQWVQDLFTSIIG
jgi:hypothetical protein